MIVFDPRSAARAAVAPSPARPATAVLLNSPAVRLVVFRIAPGQAVPPHRHASTVLLTVLEGEGMLSGADGAERLCRAGDTVAYDPNESHGMRATDVELHLLAVIVARPGERQAPQPLERVLGAAADPRIVER